MPRTKHKEKGFQKQSIKKKASKLEAFFFCLGYPDSNQERQDQNLQCYHYTIPQCLVCYQPLVELRVQR